MEQDPEEVLDSLHRAVQMALATCQNPHAIQAAGLGTQRSSLVFWRQPDGKALSPILSWQDRRAASLVGSFSQHAELIRERTGMWLSPHYGALKVLWCLEHLREVKAASADGTLCWGPLASFLWFRLARDAPFLVDPSCAQRTLLWSMKSGDWDPELVQLFGISRGQRPRCMNTLDAFGELPVAGHPVPLHALTGDQGASLFCTGKPRFDIVFVNVGTGAFLQKLCPEESVDPPRLLTSIVYRDETELLHTTEGCIHGAGSALLTLKGEPEELLKQLPDWLADPQEPPLFLNGISGLGSPYWIADFPSRFVGAGESWQQAVAVLESIVFLIQVNLEELEGTQPPYKEITISGGLTRLDGLCQRVADLSGVPVRRASDVEATLSGIGWLAAGRPEIWGDEEAAVIFQPQPNPRLQGRFHTWREQMPEPPR